MHPRHLGILALIGSPWLCIGSYVEGKMPELSDSWFTGVWGILFISGWICSAIALNRLRATGTTFFGRTMLVALIVFLTIANISNVIQVIAERDKPSYFMVLDAFWPLSNLVMLIVGIMVIVVKGLPGWKRYVPFATGMWFPLAMLSLSIDDRFISAFLGGIYSALAWALLAVAVMTTENKRNDQPSAVHKPA